METNLFAQRLKTLRKQKKLSLDELATQIGVSKTALSRYENGIRSPKLEILHALAEYFSVDMAWLSGFSSAENKNSVTYSLKGSKEDCYLSETFSNYDSSTATFELQKIYSDLPHEKQLLLIDFAKRLKEQD